MLIRDKP